MRVRAPTCGPKLTYINSIGVLIFLIIFLGLTITLQPEGLSEVIKGIISFLGAVVPATLLFIREHLKSKKEESKVENDYDQVQIADDSFDVFIFGHSGTGKTTFIQRLFTFDTSPLKSTKEFDYYEINTSMKLMDLQKDKTKFVRISDYKGQNVTQLFEAARENHHIDCVMFFADVAPAYDQFGNRLNIEQIVELMSKDYQAELLKRVNIHRYKYLSEFLLQAVFTYAASDSLKSVRLLINKIDVLQILQAKGVIDEKINLDEYVLDLFAEPISHIKKFCDANEIFDFETNLISVIKSQNVREVFTDIIKTY